MAVAHGVSLLMVGIVMTGVGFSLVSENFYPPAPQQCVQTAPHKTKCSGGGFPVQPLWVSSLISGLGLIALVGTFVLWRMGKRTTLGR